MFGDVEDGEQLKCRIESRGDDYFRSVTRKYQEIYSGTQQTGGCGDRCGCAPKSLKQIVMQYTKRIEMVNTSQPVEDVEKHTIDLINNVIGV